MTNDNKQALYRVYKNDINHKSVERHLVVRIETAPVIVGEGLCGCFPVHNEREFLEINDPIEIATESVSFTNIELKMTLNQRDTLKNLGLGCIVLELVKIPDDGADQILSAFKRGTVTGVESLG